MNTDIRVSTNLGNHPKIRMLSTRLKISRAQAVGHMVLLWSNAAIYKPTGILSGWTPDDLANFSGVPRKKSEIFRSSLISVGLADVIEGTDEISLHNWNIHQEYVIKAPQRIEKAKRAANLRWVRENYNKQCPGEFSELCYEHYYEQCYEQCPFNATSNATSNAPNRTLPNPTEPNPTEPNPPKPQKNVGGGGVDISGGIFKIFKNIIGEIPPVLIDELKYYDENCKENWIKEAFLELSRSKDIKNPWKYVKAILDKWIENGEMETRKNGNNGHGSKDDISPHEYIEKYGHMTKKVGVSDDDDID